MNKWPLALAWTLLSAQGWAQDVEPNEDPFSEDRPESEGEAAPDDAPPADDADGEAPADARKIRSFGGQGDVAIAVERLIGFAHTERQTEVIGGPDLKTDTTRRHLLMNSGGSDFVGYSAARVGFDWFAWDGVSLGIAAGASAETGPYDSRQYTVAPRVGYAHMFGKVVGGWARAGMTYQDSKADDVKAALLAVGGTIDLVLVPTKNVILLAGPRVDASVVGKLDRPNEKKVDLVATELGFSAGFGIFF